MKLEFICPKCGKPMALQNAVMDRSHSAQAPDFTYFLCSECRLMKIDRRIVRSQIAVWRQSTASARQTPYRAIMGEVNDLVEKIRKYYLSIGYQELKNNERRRP
jgi:hypothetical protein